MVVWNIFFIFPYIWNVIIPTDELIFFRGVAQPPTSNGKYIYIYIIYIYLDIFTIDHSYPSELNGPRKNPTMMPLLVPVVHACTAGRCHVALRGVGGHRWAPVCMFGRGGGSEMQQYFTICHIL